MKTLGTLGTGMLLLVLGATAVAYDLNEKLSIGGVIAGSMQCQRLYGKAGADNDCQGALPIQPEASYRPTEHDEMFIKFGFAIGNGLTDEAPFVLAPWAADLHDDVNNINGSSRNYLLTAWYRHTFIPRQGSSVDATIGIIDATDYLDENTYSNDEYRQFMNEALVNGPNTFLPSYDVGGALLWDTGSWSLRGVVMNVNENDDGNEYLFYGAQLGYTLQSRFGEGNYRVLLDRTSKDFLASNGESRHKRTSILFSLDQQLGDLLGAFLRFGWQDESAAVDYHGIWSGGIDIHGMSWMRGEDNIGLGYAYLDGGNLGIRHSQAAEAYYRFVIDDYFALTADVQYMKDDLRNQENPAGFIYGLRITSEF